MADILFKNIIIFNFEKLLTTREVRHYIKISPAPVLRIPDVYPGSSQIPDNSFSIPAPTFFHPGSNIFPSRIRIKEFTVPPQIQNFSIPDPHQRI
jgi:hypothetical protein